MHSSERPSPRLSWLVLASCLGGCTAVPFAQVCPVTSNVFDFFLFTPRRPKVDLLLVIDNSAHMVPKQAALAGTFGALLDQLNRERFDFDYHIGIVSTDIGSWVAPGQPWTQSAGACDSFAGDDGRLQAVSCLERQNGSAAAARACSSLCPDRRFLPTDGSSFLSRHNGVANVPVALELDPKTGRMIDRGPEHALSCMALLGDSGCTLSSPLEAMKRALDGHLPGNRDFLRPDSALQIVILTDKDDCSVQNARRSENDPRTRSCATPDQAADYDCYNPAFRCLGRDLKCDQPLNIAGNKTGCHERPDSYLQPVDDYARFLSALRPDSYSVSILGLWSRPALDDSGQLVVVQDSNVAGSGGLAAQAVCQAAGDPSWQGQPQQRLSHLPKTLYKVIDIWPPPVANICEPQNYSMVVVSTEQWWTHSSVMSCVFRGPALQADGTPNCVAGDVALEEPNETPAVPMPACQPSCCAAMPSSANLNRSWSWDNATIAACTSEPASCFCFMKAESDCGYAGGFAAGVWRAGNADLPRATAVRIRCAGSSVTTCPPS